MRPEQRLEQFLESHARLTPNKTAAIEPQGFSVSYERLNAEADRICATLIAHGVRPGDRVGLLLPKNVACLAAVYGILKAKAAYVPVDVGGPDVRAAYIFSDGAVAAVIVETPRLDALQTALQSEHASWTRGAFDAEQLLMAGLSILTPDQQPSDQSRDQRLAYVLYTSGSTGQPKGVMHSHATALSFVDWCSAEFDPGANDRFSSHAPFHFDLSILDLYVCGKHGASVVLIDSDEGKQPGRLAQIIAEQGITIWYSTPTILRMLVEFGRLEDFDHSALRLVFFAGEVFAPKHLRALRSHWPQPVYYNLYGPTETNVCTYFRLPPFDPIEPDIATPIGSVCSGDVARVVDADDREVQAGEQGELWVRGGSVMLGYWNLPARNAEAFREVEAVAWYRTGDVVREIEGGNYVYLGRRDRMVKRRGYRVELGEIEAALSRHPSVSEAAVVALSAADADIEIFAFLMWTDPKPMSLIRLKKFCGEHIPLYMLPDRFVAQEQLPKTASDKIDYQRLKELAHGLRAK